MFDSRSVKQCQLILILSKGIRPNISNYKRHVFKQPLFSSARLKIVALGGKAHAKGGLGKRVTAASMSGFSVKAKRGATRSPFFLIFSALTGSARQSETAATAIKISHAISQAFMHAITASYIC